MPSALKAFAVATRRIDFDSPKQPSAFEACLMRSYEIDQSDTNEQKLTNDEDATLKSESGTQSETDLPLLLPGPMVKLWEAMAATTALPVLSKRLEVDIKG
mmetsp:Transcript_18057/g.27931  ORF Transcript_18057/g.27931 Transcript_18057/m.27931 type:complete len:101 (-) Transcript_18057:322-624(-)